MWAGPPVPLIDKYGNERSPDEARIIKDMCDEEVGKFVAENRIDGPAGADLRREAFDVQLAVLERGALSVCTNPSAALIGRIRDAKRQIAEGSLLPLKNGGGGGAAPLPMPAASALLGGSGFGSDLDKFVAENRLDQGAQSSLRAESGEVQRKVMEGGPLFNCSNPSAALMGRIRIAKSGGTSKFVGNENASFNTAPPSNQATLTALASLLGGTKPAVMRLELPAPAAPPAVDSQALKAAAAAAEMALALVAPPKDEAPQGGGGMSNEQDSQLQLEALKAIQMMLNASQGGAESDSGFRARTATLDDVQRFIAENRLDDASALSLKAESPEVQGAVLARGSLAESMNPSAALMGRIATAKLGAAGVLPSSAAGLVGGGAQAPHQRFERASPSDVDRFLQENKIDDRAARELLVESMEVQTTVLNRGPLSNCSNPSSALLGRIRDAKRTVAGLAGGGFGAAPRSAPY